MHDPAVRDVADRVQDERPHRLTRRAVLAGVAGAAACALPLQQVSARTNLELKVDAILDGMSLKERIGQLFMFQALDVRMTTYFQGMLDTIKPGGIIFVQPNIGSPDDIRRFVKAIHDSNKAVPPMIAIDQEGGDVIRLPGDPVPGAIALGRLSDDDVRAKARQRARFLAGYGFDVNFAPVADVAYTSSSMMYLRSFGSDPKHVASKVEQMVRGSRQISVMGAAKHFPGHGRTSVDSHFAMPTVDLDWKEWLKSDAVPFKAAIKARVEMVMIGHLKYTKWDDRPMSISKVAVEALRDELGFDGVIVTDDLGMGALAGMKPLDVLDQAMDAGVDLFLYTMPPLPWNQLVEHVEKRVKDERVSEKRLNASVRRLLNLKVQHFSL